MKLALAVALVLASTACKKEEKPAGAGSAGSAAASADGGDCSKITAAVDAMAGNGPMAGAAADVPAKLKAILTTRCTEDKWPKAVIDCYANEAKDMGGMKKCRTLLPPELSQKLMGEIMAAMAGAAGGMPPAGHGMAGSGSAAGGSAAPTGDEAMIEKTVVIMEEMAKAIDAAGADCAKMAGGVEGVLTAHEGDIAQLKALKEKMKDDKEGKEKMKKAAEQYKDRMMAVMPKMMGMMKCKDDPKMKALEAKMKDLR